MVICRKQYLCINHLGLLTKDFIIMFVASASKVLYGIKQAPRPWYQRFANFLLQIGFVIATSDTSLVIYKHISDMAYLLLYVDVIILCISTDSL